ncbi:hypothetical protein FB451DRAFT_1210947 [Mycena latifolia]|nr:hypothetical protein FB451DRAFT_1210947 [Mycena latifolia]
MSEPYVSAYEKHLEQLRAHLSGNTAQPLSPSFVHPAGYWTSREKDYFFHALAVHSRLRPDLIAESVKSKNVLDVCAYIDALDEAAAARPLELSPLRSALEGAMEVSDSWVQYEEEQASVLTKLEVGWEGEAKEHRRSVLLAGRFQDQPAYWSWKQEQEDQWAKQDVLAQLGLQHLQIMNRLIQNVDANPRETEPPLPPTPTDVLIDPVLLALPLSGSSPPTLQPVPSQEHTTRPSPNSPALAGPSSPILNSHQPPSDGHLSPASRRRLQARLYMRKRRAQKAGTEVNLTPALLSHRRRRPKEYVPKPNPPKKKQRKPKKLNQGDPDDEQEDESHQPNLDADAYAPDDGRIVRGITRPYQILATFKDRGIDGNMLIESGFDIFNLSNIGKLMGLFQSVYADADEKTVVSSISPDTIKLLHAILLDFTSTVVHRAISMREQEINLKGKIKVWRLDKEDEITSENVLDALQMHGLNEQSLLTRTVQDSRADSDSVDVRSDENDDYTSPRLEQPSVEDESPFHARLPIHRELVPPLVVTPPWKPEDTSLLPAETDTDELLAELDDESKLDELDRQLEAGYEKYLWEASRAK